MGRVSASDATFAAFFDDAAIFPPGLAELHDAVHDHLARRGSPQDDLVGPLLLTTDKVHDAAKVALEAGESTRDAVLATPLRVFVVVAPGALNKALELAAEPPAGVEIVGLEAKTDEDWGAQLDYAVAAATSSSVRIHVELSTDAALRGGGIVRLAGTAARLKYRTGGLEEHLFPTPAALGAVAHAAVAHGVPFKLTAGLHRAVRYQDASTGFQHHGFLNIAVGAARAQQGGDAGDVTAALEIDAPAALAEEFEGCGARWRSAFESFGTCSILEPIETLVALDLLDPSLLP